MFKSESVGEALAKKVRTSGAFHRGTRAQLRLALAVILGLSGMAVAGFGAAPSSAAASSTLNVAMLNSVESLNPADAASGVTWTIDLAYQSVLNTNSKGQLSPGLATSWHYVGTSNETFVFNLRTDAEFSDGTPVTAAAVANSINYFKTGTGATTALFADFTAAATGTYQVTITSTQPNPLIGLLLTPWYLGGDIIGPTGLADPASLDTASDGAGPYVLDNSATVADSKYTYTPNPHYYDPSQIYYNQVVVNAISTPTAMLEAFNTGEVSVALGDVSTVGSVNKSNTNVLTYPGYWLGLFINDRDGTVAPALKNVLVRQAMNYAVNRKIIAKAIYGKYGTATDQPSYPGYDGYNASLQNHYPYDPKLAKQLLKKAGYGHGFTLSGVYLNETSDVAKVDEAVAAELGAVGIKLQLKADTNDFYADFYSKKIPLASFPLTGLPQIVNTDDVFLPGGDINPFDCPDATLQEALNALAADPISEQGSQAKAVEKIIVDQALSLPVVRAASFWYVSKSIAGVSLVPGSVDGISNIRTWHPAN